MPTGKKKRSIWKSKAEYFLFRIVEGAIQLLPPRFADALGVLLGKIAYYLVPSRRRIVERNFRIAWELQEDELRHATKLCMETCGANLLGGVRCGKMSDAEIAQCVEIEGAEILQEAARAGKGVIVALAHMGNWEILARLGPLVKPGNKFGAYFRPLDNPFMNQLIARRRTRNGMTLFSKENSFGQAASFLREGGILGILSDQNAGKAGEYCTFFGRNTSCSPLPSLLHKRTDAPVFFASVARLGIARWKVVIHQHDHHADTPSIMQGIEKALRVSPVDGFWLQDRWKIVTRWPLLPMSRKSCFTPATKHGMVYIHLSSNKEIRDAAIPALKSLTQGMPDLLFFTNIPNVLPEQVQLEKNPENWDRYHIQPLDVVIWCDEPPNKNPKYPCLAFTGCGSRKIFTNGLTTPVNLADPESWLLLIKTLGYPPPYST